MRNRKKFIAVKHTGRITKKVGLPIFADSKKEAYEKAFMRQYEFDEVMPVIVFGNRF